MFNTIYNNNNFFKIRNNNNHFRSQLLKAASYKPSANSSSNNSHAFSTTPVFRLRGNDKTEPENNLERGQRAINELIDNRNCEGEDTVSHYILNDEQDNRYENMQRKTDEAVDSIANEAMNLDPNNPNSVDRCEELYHQLDIVYDLFTGEVDDLTSEAEKVPGDPWHDVTVSEDDSEDGSEPDSEPGAPSHNQPDSEPGNGTTSGRNFYTAYSELDKPGLSTFLYGQNYKPEGKSSNSCIDFVLEIQSCEPYDIFDDME